MTKLWRILKIPGEIAVGIVAIIAVFHWLAPNPVTLKVLVKEDEVQLPSAYGEYLHAVDSNIQGRDTLIAIHDAAVAAAKQNKNPFAVIPMGQELKSMRAFADSVPICSSSNPHAITVKIVNNGWKIANNLKVFFPSEGFVEIAKDSKIIGSKNHTGWLDLGTLEPSSQFIVTMWTSIPREGIRVVSDAGAANVRQWYVSRDENRWVIGFGPFEIVFFGCMGLIVGLAVLGFVVDVMQSPSKKTTGPDEQTKAGSSN